MSESYTSSLRDKDGNVVGSWTFTTDDQEAEQIHFGVMEADCCWPRPILASERLPEPQESVLFWFQDQWWCGHMVKYRGEGKHWWETEPDDGEAFLPIEDTVSHWLPLPPAPE